MTTDINLHNLARLYLVIYFFRQNRYGYPPSRRSDLNTEFTKPENDENKIAVFFCDKVRNLAFLGIR